MVCRMSANFCGLTACLMDVYDNRPWLRLQLSIGSLATNGARGTALLHKSIEERRGPGLGRI